jgi:hypothetical protein
LALPVSLIVDKLSWFTDVLKIVVVVVDCQLYDSSTINDYASRRPVQQCYRLDECSSECVIIIMWHDVKRCLRFIEIVLVERFIASLFQRKVYFGER